MVSNSCTPTTPDTASEFHEELRHRAVIIALTAANHIRRRRVELGLEGIANSMQTKSSDVDPVTVVDQESEALIRKLIGEYRPGDIILGEEEGVRAASGPQSANVEKPSTANFQSAAQSERSVTWVVDPIDGTVNFLYGIPVYSVSIACRIGETVVAGAVADVVAQRVFSAALGQGARVVLNDGRSLSLSVRRPQSLAKSLVATGFSYGAHRRSLQGDVAAKMLGRCRDIRRMGSAAMDLCLVAAGSLDAYYEHGLNEWDYAAGTLIAAEAGAIVVRPAIGATSADGEGVFAAAPSIADEFFAVLDELNAGVTHSFEE